MNPLLKTVLLPAVFGSLIMAIMPWYPAWENTFYDKRMIWFLEKHPRAQEILLIGMQRSPREYICGNYSSRGQTTTEKTLTYTLETLNKLSPKAVALAFRLPNCEALKHLGAKLAPLRNQGIPLVLIPPKTSAVTESNVPRTLLLQDLYLEEDPNLYRVQHGDTLSMIAYRFHTTVRALKSLNNLPDDKIAHGKRLLISQKENKSFSHLPNTLLTAIGTLEIKTQDTDDGILRTLDLGSRIAPIGILLTDLLNLKQATPIDSSSKMQSTAQKEQTWRIAYSESWHADPKPFHYQSLNDFSLLNKQATEALINDKIVILFDATEESTVRTPRGERVPRAYIHAQVLLNRLTGITITTTSWWQTVCLVLLSSIAMASLYHISSYRRRSNSTPVIIWLYPLGWSFFLFLIFGMSQYLAFVRTQHMVAVIPPFVTIVIAAFGVAILTWHQSFTRVASRMEDMQSERDALLDERARLLETKVENTEEILKMDRQLNQKTAAILLLEGDLKQQKDFQRQYLPHKVPLKPLKDESLAELEQEAKSLGIVTRDRAMLQAFDTLKQLSAIQRPILIYGETGTGKELYAKASHRLSDRPNGPFEAINMGELSGEKRLQQLFGTAKAAFTGVHASDGLLQKAHGGTLFLDEIANLDTDGQQQILRVLAEHCFTPLGGKTSIKTNVRLIFATNKNLKKEWGEGRFMGDLYRRIAVGGIIQLTPLRHRDKEDLQLITKFLLEGACKELRRNSIPQLTEGALEWIFKQPWTGNVRELDGVLYRSLMIDPESSTIQQEYLEQALDAEVTSDTPMTPHSSPLLFPEVTDPLTTQLSDEEFMGKFCECHGIINQLAEELGLSRDRVTLRVKGLAFEAICQGENPPNYEQCCDRMRRGHALSRGARRKLEKKLKGYWNTLVKTCRDCPSPDETIASISTQNVNMPTRKHYLRDLEDFIKKYHAPLSNR